MNSHPKPAALANLGDLNAAYWRGRHDERTFTKRRDLHERALSAATWGFLGFLLGLGAAALMSWIESVQ